MKGGHSQFIPLAILLLAAIMFGILYIMQSGDTEQTKISLQPGNIGITGKGAV